MNKIFTFIFSLLLVSLSTCIPKLPVHVGKGYDILQGNPLTDTIDPGFQNQIFSYSYEQKLTTEDGNYLIPDGMRATVEASCSFDSNSKEVTGEHSYQESLKQSVSVEGGYNNGIASASFTASVNYQSANEETVSDKRVVYYSNGQCAKYTLTVPSFDTLPLENDFIFGVGRAYSGEMDWSLLISRYGTHYVVKETLGGRMVISTSFSLQDIQFLKSNSIDINAGLKASYAEFSGSVNSGTEKASKFNKATSNMNVIKRYIYIGGESNDESLSNKYIFFLITPFVK